MRGVIIFSIMVNLLRRTMRSGNNGIGLLFTVFCFSLNFGNGRCVVARLRMSSLRSCHSFFSH